MEDMITISKAKKTCNKILNRIDKISKKIIKKDFEFTTSDLLKIANELITLNDNILHLKKQVVVKKLIVSGLTQVEKLMNKVDEMNLPEKHSDNVFQAKSLSVPQEQN